MNVLTFSWTKWSTSDVQQLQDQCASCLKSDIHDGDDDDVDEDKKCSNVNTKINSLIDVGILKEVLKNKMHTRSSSFFRAVTEYILFGDLNQVHPSQSEVLDYEVRKKLEELEAITNPEMFVQEASFNFPERFSAGYCKLVVNVEDKEELIRYVALHYAVSCCQAELDQFIKGLELHGVLNPLCAHPN